MEEVESSGQTVIGPYPLPKRLGFGSGFEQELVVTNYPDGSFMLRIFFYSYRRPNILSRKINYFLGRSSDLKRHEIGSACLGIVPREIRKELSDVLREDPSKES